MMDEPGIIRERRDDRRPPLLPDALHDDGDDRQRMHGEVSYRIQLSDQSQSSGQSMCSS